MFDRLLQLLRLRPRRRGRGRAPGNFKRGRRAGSAKTKPGHVLEVPKMSRKMAKNIRVGRWKAAVKFACLAGVGVAIFSGGKSVLAKHFWNSPELLVARADLQTTGRLTYADILRAAGLEETTHVYDVDLRAVQDRLLARPDIRDATVERLLPGKLSIRLEEREPLAWLSCNSPPLQPFTANPRLGGALLDEEGWLFECRELRSELMKLPVIHVRRLPHTQPGLRLADEPVQGGLRLLQLIRRHFGPRGLDVVEIDAPNDWSLVAKFTDDSVVTFGYDDLEGQMSRLTQVMDVTTAKNFRLATVNLLPRKNVPVTFRGEAGPLTSSSSISTGATAVPSSTPSRPLPAVKPPPREVGRQLEEILGGGR